MAKENNKQTPSHKTTKQTKEIKKQTKKIAKEKKIEKKNVAKQNKQKAKNIATHDETINSNECKHIIDIYATTNTLHKFRLREDYFDICKNYWLIEKYIAKYGLYDKESPANTISAYDKAIEKGYPVTISVQMLKDFTLVCFAEKSLAHMTGLSGYLNNCTYDDIKDLSLLGTEHKIPTLQEVLDHIGNKVEVVIDIINELHCGKMEEMVLGIVAKYIEKYDCFGKVAIMSTNPRTLEYCADSFPYVTRILKVAQFKEKEYAEFKTKKLTKLKYYKLSKADFIAYPSANLPYWRLKRKKTRGVIALSVKTQEEYMRVSRYCDNIIFSEFEPKI